MRAYLKLKWTLFILALDYWGEFLKTAFSKKGLGSSSGRTLIWGKFRRVFYSYVPGLAAYLKKKTGITGGCNRCGTSCKILFKCPQFEEGVGCKVYENRPLVCKLFPITPTDISDRNLVAPSTSCGYAVDVAKDKVKKKQNNARQAPVTPALFPPTK